MTKMMLRPRLSAPPTFLQLLAETLGLSMLMSKHTSMMVLVLASLWTRSMGLAALLGEHKPPWLSWLAVVRY